MNKSIVILLLSLVAASALALTPTERAIVEHIGNVNKRQASELQDVRAKLVWTDKELQDTQPKITQLGVERDTYKGLYEKDHEKVLKQKNAILKLIMLSSVLGIGLLVMIVWKFKLYRLIPGMTLAP